ncbi:hypothetical protein RIF29_27472 [Crotalaria pallida]|uniref:Aluminum-activated malate transporter n=1 Tax=Crotalaria pallida TaxID=3830 RepID=A0AAN9EP47_CROPI
MVLGSSTRNPAKGSFSKSNSLRLPSNANSKYGGSGEGRSLPHIWNLLMALRRELTAKVMNLMLELKKVGEDDPRRVIHSLKVALAITLVSAFYYVKPLYNGFGSSAIWAVFTTILVSEFSVGATIGKGLNRGLATLLGGLLGLGCYYIANLISTGDILEPILLGTIIFLITAGVTYMRFLPQIKARYDYGLLVFILTLCLVSVSSYRSNEIIEIAKKRVITILAGGLISLLVCIFVYPVWSGDDLHKLVSQNIEKLGNFLEGFGDEYFETLENGESNKSFMEEYKSVLNSKQAEESLANFARWEPCHGPFTYRHAWQQYPKIGSISRLCAYRIDALNGFLNSTNTPSKIRSKIQEPCIKMSTETGKALKELAVAIQQMIPPSAADSHIAKSKIASMNLKSILNNSRLWEDTTNLFEAIPIMTVASLLVDLVSCTEKLAESIQELSTLAKFKNIISDSKVAPENLNCLLHHQEEAPVTLNCDESGPHHVITINLQPSTNLSHAGSS